MCDGKGWNSRAYKCVKTISFGINDLTATESDNLPSALSVAQTVTEIDLGVGCSLFGEEEEFGVLIRMLVSLLL